MALICQQIWKLFTNPSLPFCREGENDTLTDSPHILFLNISKIYFWIHLCNDVCGS